jgi:hypothetical protein
MEPLSFYRDALRADGLDTALVDRLVSAIAISNPPGRLELFAKLEEQADLLSWPQDRDYAAIALHLAALSVSDPFLRHDMLSVATSRAARCASCATSGGEGISRSSHVHELEMLMANHSMRDFQSTPDS